MWLPVFLLLAAGPADAVRAVIAAQEADWNRGDLAAFVAGYHDSPSTAFVSKDGVNRGVTGILDRYRRNYSTREKMGVLTFTDLEVRLLGDRHALATGRYRLKRTPAGGRDSSGWFSLVFEKTAQGWKIVLDHTSAS